MEEFVSAKDFRLKFTEMCQKVLSGRSFTVLRRSKPIFQVIPMKNDVSDLLNRASENGDQGPSLNELNAIVHQVRQEVD